MIAQCSVVFLSTVPLLQDHFSNNDFLGVRVRVIGVRVILRGKLWFYRRSKGGLEKWSWRRKMSFITTMVLHILPL